MSFATAADVRVVHQPDAHAATEEQEAEEELVDVPRDGRTIGEVVFRGNIVMKEYFRDAEATRRAFRGGYFHSGDLAVWHPDGAIAIVDRSKDIIISGGEVGGRRGSDWEFLAYVSVHECRTRRAWLLSRVRRTSESLTALLC